MDISLADAAVKGFLNVLQLKVFAAMLVGLSIGTFTAVAPQGLGIPFVYAILLPVVIKWEPVTGVSPNRMRPGIPIFPARLEPKPAAA